MVSHSILKKCPVTKPDVTNSHAIFGPELPGTRGRTVRRPPIRVNEDYVEVPRDFYELHKLVTLTADVMFVNGLPFLATFRCKIRLTTV